MMKMHKPIVRLFRKLKRDISGVALTEMALVVPFLSVMTIGTVDYSMYVLASMTVQGAARAGADYAAATGYDNAAITSRITNTSSHAGNLSAITANPAPTQWYGCPNANGSITTVSTSTSVCSGTSLTAGTYVTSSAQATYTFVLAWPGAARTQTLTSSVKVRIN
jgi:Flp pilus assembly protein TadG